MSDEEEMQLITFCYRQKATLSCTAHASVPKDIVAKGDEATRAWLRDNGDKWEDDETTDTDFGSIVPNSVELT